MTGRHALIGALTALAVGAPPAAAHVQISPTIAAPDDAVLFQLLVPNERPQGTVAVALRIPAGVLPYSFEDAPGWRRSETKAADGSVGVVTWRGRLAPDGFARFAFLASTPPKGGDVAWKAVQTYADGKVVRWIGSPTSDTPAAVTKIVKGAAKQNAGGEGSGGGAPAVATVAPVPAAPVAVRSTGTHDTLALVLAGAALALAAGGLLRRR